MCSAYVSVDWLWWLYCSEGREIMDSTPDVPFFSEVKLTVSDTGCFIPLRHLSQAYLCSKCYSAHRVIHKALVKSTTPITIKLDCAEVAPRSTEVKIQLSL